jgi:hypothetical protein
MKIFNRNKKYKNKIDSDTKFEASRVKYVGHCVNVPPGHAAHQVDGNVYWHHVGQHFPPNIKQIVHKKNVLLN